MSLAKVQVYLLKLMDDWLVVNQIIDGPAQSGGADLDTTLAWLLKCANILLAPA